MDATTLVDGEWSTVLQMLPKDLEQSAADWGALQRKREIKSAADLIRIALLYGFGNRSLRMTAAFACGAEVANVSDVDVLKRLRLAAPWLGHVVFRFLQDRGMTTDVPRFRVRVVDATAISEPASKGTDWRFHIGLDLAHTRIASVELTGPEGGETLLRHSVCEDEIMLADRGYGHRRGVASVIDRRGHVVVRISWQNFPLLDQEGQRLDTLGLLDSLESGESGDWDVCFEANGRRYPVRLVALRKTEADAVKEQRRVKREASRKKHTPDPRSLRAAHFVVLITDLPREMLSAENALQLYRLRWQIEIVFKRLKGILHLDHLRAKDPALAQAYLYAGILGALIVQELCRGKLEFPPRSRRFRYRTGQPLAGDATGRGYGVGSYQRAHQPGTLAYRPTVDEAIPM